MKSITLYFAILTGVLCMAVVLEVMNIHGFLATDGAFVRVAVLLVGAIFWRMFFKNTQSKLVGVGTVMMCIVAMLYFFYGVSSFCQNTYYEINREAFANSRTDIEPYSCSKILRGQLFQ